MTSQSEASKHVTSEMCSVLRYYRRARLHGEDWGAVVRPSPPSERPRLNRPLVLP